MFWHLADSVSLLNVRVVITACALLHFSSSLPSEMESRKEVALDVGRLLKREHVA